LEQLTKIIKDSNEIIQLMKDNSVLVSRLLTQMRNGNIISRDDKSNIIQLIQTSNIDKLKQDMLQSIGSLKQQSIGSLKQQSIGSLKQQSIGSLKQQSIESLEQQSIESLEQSRKLKLIDNNLDSNRDSRPVNYVGIIQLLLQKPPITDKTMKGGEVITLVIIVVCIIVFCAYSVYSVVQANNDLTQVNSGNNTTYYLSNKNIIFANFGMGGRKIKKTRRRLRYKLSRKRRHTRHRR
jgi:hypothetical protein